MCANYFPFTVKLLPCKGGRDKGYSRWEDGGGPLSSTAGCSHFSYSPHFFPK